MKSTNTFRIGDIVKPKKHASAVGYNVRVEGLIKAEVFKIDVGMDYISIKCLEGFMYCGSTKFGPGSSSLAVKPNYFELVGKELYEIY